MFKFVSQQISQTFQDDGSKDQAKEYSEKVYAAWKDVSASLSRSAILIFLLMAFFELLIYQHTSTVISIGTFTLVDAPIVQIVLPTIVAFVIYDGFRLSSRWLNLQFAYVLLTEIYAPRQRDNGLDILIKPSLPSFWAIGSSGSNFTGTPADRFMRRVNSIVSYTTLLVVPVAFECQAFYRLIQKFGYYNILLWINLVVTALLLVCTGLYVLLETYAE